MSSLKAYTQLLCEALEAEAKPFHAEGSLSFPPEQLNLFYKTAGDGGLGLESVSLLSYDSPAVDEPLF
jgi:hypothetical protein